MTRPGAPSSRGRHSAPEEGPGRHAAPEPAPPGRRRHAAPDFSDGYGDGPSRRRHAAEEDAPPEGYWGVPAAYQADGPEAVSRHREEPAPVNGYHDPSAPPVNGHYVAEPVVGFPYTAPALDAPTAWPVNGHGVDGAERDAAEWPVNGHAAAPPLNGHGTTSNGHVTAWSLNGTAHPLNGDHTPWSDEPGIPPNGSSAWPLDGHQVPPVNGVNGHQAPPVNGHQAAPVNGVNGHQAPPVNGHSAVNGSAPAPLAGWQREPFRPSYPALPREVPELRPAPTVVPPAVLPPPAPTSRTAPASVPAPTTAGPGPAPGGASAAFALDAADESTQVLRRFVPASETLGREKAERPAGRPATPPHPPRAVVRRRQARRRRLEWPFLIVFALLSAYLIRAYVVQTFYIPSASMHETLIEGDRVLVNKISYRVHDVRRGDVIVFTKPPKLTADEDDLIKRVVALPGETVEGRGGKVYINGAPLTEPYVAPSCSVNTSDFAPLTVPAGDLWVMGDNRCNSADSRFFGVIAEKTVVGRAFVLVWPVGRFSGL